MLSYLGYGGGGNGTAHGDGISGGNQDNEPFIESKLDVLVMKEQYMRTEKSKRLSNTCIAIRWWGAVSYTGREKNRNSFSWRRRGWWTVRNSWKRMWRWRLVLLEANDKF